MAPSQPKTPSDEKPPPMVPLYVRMTDLAREIRSEADVSMSMQRQAQMHRLDAIASEIDQISDLLLRMGDAGQVMVFREESCTCHGADRKPHTRQEHQRHVRSERKAEPMSMSARERAAQLAEEYFPDYLGQWIANTLRAAHTLPTVVEHQEKIANDILGLFGPAESVPPGSVEHVVFQLLKIGAQHGPRLPVWVTSLGKVTIVRYSEAGAEGDAPAAVIEG